VVILEQVDLAVVVTAPMLVAEAEAVAEVLAFFMSTQTSSVGERLLLRQLYKPKVDWAVTAGHLLALS